MSLAQENTQPNEKKLKLRVVRVTPTHGETPAPLTAPGQELRKGRVTECNEDVWRVKMLDDAVVISAKRATGCLLLPQIKDVVLLLFDRAGEAHYLLNVLERESDEREMDFPKDACISAKQGALRLQANELAMEGGEKAELTTKELCLAATHGNMRFIRLNLLAGSLDAGVQHIMAASERCKLVARHMSSRIGRVIRNTGFELHRAERVRTEVEKSCVIKAERASILTEKDVTIDSGKINLG